MKIQVLSFTIALLCVFQGIWAQNYTFAYDANGSRTGRTIPLKSTSLLAVKDSTQLNSVDEHYSETIGDVAITLFPNPAKGNIFLKIENLDLNLPSILSLYDNNGRLLKTKVSLLEFNTIDLSYLPPGNYFIKIILSDTISDWKVIKE